MAGIPESFLKKHAVAVAIQTDRICPSCDYNLKGLSVGGNCPECGTPILPAYSDDEPLSRMPLRVISTFRHGSWLAALSVSIVGAAHVAIFFNLFSYDHFPLIAFTAISIWAAAIWMMTPAMVIPEAVTRGFCKRSLVRHIARIGQLGLVLAGVAKILQTYMSTTTSLDLIISTMFNVGMVVGIVGMIALSVMMERLAEWVRDDTAEKAFQWFQWLLPITLLIELYSPIGFIGRAALFISYVLLLLFPIGILILAKSITFAAVHSVDHQEREVRRIQRKKQDADKMFARLHSMDKALEQQDK